MFISEPEWMTGEPWTPTDAHHDEARKAMDALLDGPLTFTPIEVSGGKRYKIEGPVAIGNLFVTEPEPGFKL